MDSTFLRLYNEELQYIREQSGEFAKLYPKIAGRLTLDADAQGVCPDPFVERLLEGFAFLTARVRRKFEAEFPRFTQAMLETVYPHYLCPTPSMVVARLEPELSDGALVAGPIVARGTSLRTRVGRDEVTPCEYRTAHDVALWPLHLREARYFTHDLATLGLPLESTARAALRLTFEIKSGATADDLKALSHLDLYLSGKDEIPTRLFEQMIGQQAGGVVALAEPREHRRLPDLPCRRLGLTEDEALLPRGPRTFEGYRLLREYMAFPQRFLFTRVLGIGPALAGSKARNFDVILLFTQSDEKLNGRIDRDRFGLFCTPAINLSRRRTDRIAIDGRTHEYHIVTDRTRPSDFEVFSVEKVTGIGAKGEELQTFLPFYGSRRGGDPNSAFYTTHRVTRTLANQEEKTFYPGSEVYLSMVDATAAPFSSDLKQLALEVLVTNRSLPIGLDKESVLIPEGGGLVKSARCVDKPTFPRSSFSEGDILWRLISHLSLNYLSLDGGSGKGDPGAFRELLRLYTDVSDVALMKQIDGVTNVFVRPVTRRLESLGPVSFVRGSEISLVLNEPSFEGSGVFLFGSVIERFLTRYASINSFTETVIQSPQRGEIMRWPIQTGTKPLL